MTGKIAVRKHILNTFEVGNKSHIKACGAACVKIRELSGCNKAALSGGVFQNRLLLELTDHMLKQQGFEVLKHQLVPPNDGGIALGQAVYAMAYLDRNK